MKMQVGELYWHLRFREVVRITHVNVAFPDSIGVVSIRLPRQPAWHAYASRLVPITPLTAALYGITEENQ